MENTALLTKQVVGPLEVVTTLKTLASDFLKKRYSQNSFKTTKRDPETKQGIMEHLGTTSLYAQLLAENNNVEEIPGLAHFIDLSLQPVGPYARPVDLTYVTEVQQSLGILTQHLL